MATKKAATLQEQMEEESKVLETIKDPEVKMNREIHMAQARKKSLVEYYKAQDVVDAYLSPSYAAHLGSVTQLQINGITIAFEVNGKRQRIPQAFADLLEEKRQAIDAIENKKRAMSNVNNNFESSPGALKFY